MSMRSSRSRSFTLIETVAAIVILAVGVPPLLWAIRDAQVQRVNPVLASRARWLATEKLEDIIADRHSATRGYAYLAAGNYPAEPTITGFPAFSRSVTLTETQADLSTPGSGFMIVTVSVDWMDARGVARTLAVSTVLASYSS